MQPISIELGLMLVRTVALLAALLVFAWGFRHWRRSAERDAQRIFEQLDLIRAELMLLAERMDHFESVPPRIIERPAAPDVRVPAMVSNPAARGYEVAARLARGGATCEELISSCGLSRHEAELMLRLHKAEAARSKDQVKGDERRAKLSVVG
jgi:Protein of unknown function (DUF2802)